MKHRRPGLLVAITSLVAIGLTGAVVAARRRSGAGVRTIPEPARPVDLGRYAGRWYEIGRYENRFERGCEAVSADYRMGDDGLIQVINACRRGGLDGPLRIARGRARIVPGSGNAKLKVSFFGPFFVGDYWVLDHGEAYDWSIVGEPSGRYLWLLARASTPARAIRATIEARAVELGYDPARIRPTLHQDG